MKFLPEVSHKQLLIIKTKGMPFKYILGVDMSKKWFNYCLMNENLDILIEGQVDNNADAIFTAILDLQSLDAVERLNDIHLCMEYTGVYVKPLVRCWLSKGGQLSMIHASKISESLTGRHNWENKDDALDARRIAEYGTRFQDKLQVWQAKNESLDLLQSIQRQRDRLIQVIHNLEIPVKESKNYDSKAIYDTLTKLQKNSVKALKKDLKQVEKCLEEIIDADPYLKQLFKLITSVEGVGPVTAREVMIATGGFTDFLPSQAKAFARYTGVVPYRKQSGSSVRKKERIGKRSHRKVKSLLTMGALSLLQTKSEINNYYQRKKAEGKHHLSIINAIRNKLILRIFAVVRNQVIYDKNLNGYFVMP